VSGELERSGIGITTASVFCSVGRGLRQPAVSAVVARPGRFGGAGACKCRSLSPSTCRHVWANL
jgi:hypothetical protein